MNNRRIPWKSHKKKANRNVNGCSNTPNTNTMECKCEYRTAYNPLSPSLSILIRAYDSLSVEQKKNVNRRLYLTGLYL